MENKKENYKNIKQLKQDAQYIRSQAGKNPHLAIPLMLQFIQKISEIDIKDFNKEGNK